MDPCKKKKFVNGATISFGQEIQCLPYAGILYTIFKINDEFAKSIEKAFQSFRFNTTSLVAKKGFVAFYTFFAQNNYMSGQVCFKIKNWD